MVAGNMLFPRRCSGREDMESLADIGCMPVADNTLEAGSNRGAAHNTTVEL